MAASITSRPESYPCQYVPCSEQATCEVHSSSTQWRMCDVHADGAERACAGTYFRRYPLPGRPAVSFRGGPTLTPAEELEYRLTQCDA